MCKSYIAAECKINMKTISPRLGRINDVLQRDIAKLIREKCRDPRIGFVTISSVEVANNLAFAKVYVTVLEDDKVKESLEILNHAAGFLRTELSHITILRLVPKLKFIYDSSIVNGNKIDALIDSVTCNNSNEQ